MGLLFGLLMAWGGFMLVCIICSVLGSLLEGPPDRSIFPPPSQKKFLNFDEEMDDYWERAKEFQSRNKII
jgi:hypothetical protein